jgi:hypothetical protein
MRDAWRGRRDYVLFGSPVTEVNDSAALAAKGEIRIAQGDFFLADRAFHAAFSGARGAPMPGRILNNIGVIGGPSGSAISPATGSSNVPTRS